MLLLKIIKYESKIWLKLLAKAPEKQIPKKDIFDLKRFLLNNIANTEEKEPTKEKIKIYEKKVPEINACIKTFINVKNKTCFMGKMYKDNIIPILAIPNLIKGIGFGIAYSIIDKNMHRAEKKAVFLWNTF